MPTAIADLEPTGRIQTLILFDSDRKVDGRLRRPLADKELSVLIAGVAAHGAHVVVILDCCHSGGGTRDPFVRTRGWRPDPDLVGPRAPGPRAGDGHGAAGDASSSRRAGDVGAPPPAHVALAACRSTQTAKEHRVGDVSRGAFSVALRRLARHAGDPDHVPLVARHGPRPGRPDGGGPATGAVPARARAGWATRSFLDGTVEPVPATFTVTHGFDGWEVDAGLVHGLRPPEGDEAFVLACTAPDGRPAGAVRVTDVQVGRSSVEPIGWTMEEVAYRAVVADVPLPPAEVQLDPWVAAGCRRRADGRRRRRRARRRARGRSRRRGRTTRRRRTCGSSSPAAGRARAVRLRVAVPGPGVPRSPGPTGARSPARSPGWAPPARARPASSPPDWSTSPGGSRSGCSVTTRRRSPTPSRSRSTPPTTPDAAAAGARAAPVRRRVPAGVPPRAPVARAGCRRTSTWSLRNRSADDLWVAVLDLTDRFRCHAVLETTLVGAGVELSLEDRRPIPVALPAGRPIVPGASARDWLKVVVSDVAFQATSFDLDALDEPVTRSAGRGGRRGTPWSGSPAGPSPATSAAAANHPPSAGPPRPSPSRSASPPCPASRGLPVTWARSRRRRPGRLSVRLE